MFFPNNLTFTESYLFLSIEAMKQPCKDAPDTRLFPIYREGND